MPHRRDGPGHVTCWYFCFRSKWIRTPVLRPCFRWYISGFNLLTQPQHPINNATRCCAPSEAQGKRATSFWRCWQETRATHIFDIPVYFQFPIFSLPFTQRSGSFRNMVLSLRAHIHSRYCHLEITLITGTRRSENDSTLGRPRSENAKIRWVWPFHTVVCFMIKSTMPPNCMP